MPSETWLTQDASQREFPPALRTAGRVLAALAGLAVAVAMFVVGGLFALLHSCDGYYEAEACGNLGGLVDALDLIAALGGAAAALAGGVATAATGRARWIAGGLAITVVLVFVLALLVGLQEPALN